MSSVASLLGGEQPVKGPIEQGAGEMVLRGLQTGSFEDVHRGQRTPLRRLGIHVRHARDVGVDERLEERIAIGVIQGRYEEHKGLVRVLDVDDLTERKERLCPAAPLRDGIQHRPETGRRSVGVPRGDGCIRRRDQRHTPLLYPHGMVGGALQQVGGDGRCASIGGGSGRVGECFGDTGVWPVDHGRTVNGSFDGVLRDVREGRPQRTPLARRRIGVGDGREQGVGRPQAWAVGDQDAFLARLIDRPLATVADDALDEGQVRGGRHGHDDDAPSSVPAQRGEVIADDRLNLRWDREGLTQRRFHRSSLERSTDFEAEEGVAGAGLVETDQQRSGMRHAQPLMDEPAKRPHGQRSHVHLLGLFDGR